MGALGYTMQMPEEEKYLHTAEELMTVAITGTKGKTTTTAMIAEIFEQAGIEGSSRQDFLALAALQLAISNVAMSQSREVGNDDVKALKAVSDQLEDYLSKVNI